VQLVSKISNLCDLDPPPLQTDGQMTCNINTALRSCTIVHRIIKIVSCIQGRHKFMTPYKSTNISRLIYLVKTWSLAWKSSKCFFTFH